MGCMRARVLYFGPCRQHAGCDEETIDLPGGTATVQDLLDRCCALHPGLAQARASLLVAVDREFASPAAGITGAEEIAVMPPVSGGAAGITLTTGKVSAAGLAESLAGTGEGAVATFEGVVRPEGPAAVSGHLDYDAYAPMAEAKLAEVAAEARRRFGILDLAIAHRHGPVPVGEAAVAIAVTARHRKEAFAACAFAIDRIKQIVPIWKLGEDACLRHG